MGLRSISISVVTHPKSKYPFHIWETSTNAFKIYFELHGIMVINNICSENYFNPKRISVLKLLRSQSFNTNLSLNWYSSHLCRVDPKVFFIKRIRLKFSLIKYFVSLLTDTQFLRKERTKFIRSVNISRAHISLFDNAIKNQTDMLLILEDDAFFSGNEEDMANCLFFINNVLNKTQIPSLLNLSKSLSWKQLKLEALIEDNMFLDVAPNVYLPQKMFHNTTCANIYNIEYVKKFRRDWGLKIEKLVSLGTPFDWIINALIMDLPHNEILTFHSHAPLIVQGSMHPEILGTQST